MAYVYATRGAYPSLVDLYEADILNKLDLTPTGGCVDVPPEYAPWLHDLDSTAAQLAREPRVPQGTDTTLVLNTKVSGLHEVELFSFATAEPEAYMAYETLGLAETRLVRFMQDMRANWNLRLWRNVEFKDF